jgi:hypothetical protein
VKTRLGFVSNSSSSSFVISKYYLSPWQIDQIKNYDEEGQNLNKIHENDDWDKRRDYCKSSDYDRWIITETDDEVRGFTAMDNFDMATFLEDIGVLKVAVRWEY